MDWFLTPLADFYLPLAVLADILPAGAVTIHALLRKRDVASATAWIGFAWLVPILGPLLYILLGINRVPRRARKLSRRRRRRTPGHAGQHTAPPALAPLAIAGGRITERPLLPGNLFAAMHNGDEAYPVMLASIAAARESVALSSYIFHDDALGQEFIAALAAAHRRGVAVRVLIDGIGGGYLRTPAWRRLHAEGVPAALFLHSYLPWRTPVLNLRSHRKLLIVDGNEAYTGGLNIAAENLVATNPPHAVQDTHFAVRGPVVGQIMAAFVEDWAYTTGETLSGAPWFVHQAIEGETLARVVTSGPDEDLEKIKAQFLVAIGQARRSLRIVTPYFMPDAPIAAALGLAALRGVSVQITIPEHSDHFYMNWAIRACLRPLLEAGCDIRLAPPPFDHSKLITVDGAWACIGSANWDSRSLRLNFELNVECYDAALAGEIEQMIETRPARPLTLAELDRDSLPVELRNAAARLLLPYL